MSDAHTMRPIRETLPLDEAMALVLDAAAPQPGDEKAEAEPGADDIFDQQHPPPAQVALRRTLDPCPLAGSRQIKAGGCNPVVLDQETEGS